MSAEETKSFISSYGPDLRFRICFAWNGKHADDFRDTNDSLRQEIIDAVLAEPDKAGLDLVADLFEAEAQWSKEAWCVRDSFSILGSILLNRGCTAKLNHFLDWFAVSFDSYSECHAMSLAPAILDPLISEIDRHLTEAIDNRRRKELEMARNLFVKHKSGKPLKGMAKLGRNEVKKAKIVGGSGTLIDRLKKNFKGKE
jgi:hypothetical protein